LDAAEQGSAEAQHNLGLIYAYDRDGRKADYAKAYYWLSIAAYNGVEDAPKGIRLVAKELSDEELRTLNKTLQAYFAERNADRVRQLMAGKNES
jgi:TPR repeat protein